MIYQRIIFIILLGFIVDSASAYDNKQTHPTLPGYTVEKSQTFATVLQEQLGFTDTDEKLNNGQKTRKIIEWLQDGSVEEDEPSCRAANHFHDPLKLWENSQLTDPIWAVDRFCEATTRFRTKYSSISWATGIRNSDGDLLSDDVNGTGAGVVNGRNWFVARDFFYNALTETDPQQREALFAETFHTLGYALHLIEDMAVPAHTRNDLSSCLLGICPRNILGNSAFSETEQDVFYLT